MEFDVNRLRTGEWIIGVAAVLLFVDMFLSWYGGREGFVRFNAWESFGVLDLFLLLVILVALALVGLSAGQRSPALPVAATVLVTGLAGLAALLVLIRLLDQPGFGVGAPNSVVDVKVGAYLGFVLIVAVAAGGFLVMRDEGTTLAHAKAQTEAMLSSRQMPVPPPAGQSDPPPPASTPPPPGPAPPPGAPGSRD